MKTRKIPLRKCIACGENRPKKELVRVLKNKEDQVMVDLTGKVNGRGAYICANHECFEKARKNNKFAKVLGIEVTDDIYMELEDSLKDKI